MMKVKIIFPSLLQLWDFKLIFRNRVLRTNCWHRSLICQCTETELELAVHAFGARVEKAKEESAMNTHTKSVHSQEKQNRNGLPFIAGFFPGI